MIRTSSLSGDSWLSCHFPGAQLPPWQHPVQTLCPARPAPPARPAACSAGQLTRAVSLPEQDVLRREVPIAPGNQRRPDTSSYWSLKEDRAAEDEEEEEEEEEEEASDSSGRLDSSCSVEDGPHQVLKPRSAQQTSGSRPRARNVFLPSAELDDEEEEEDSDGDNLHRYREDSSFMLHGNFNWAVSNCGRFPDSAPEKKPFDIESRVQRVAGRPARPDPPPGAGGPRTLVLDGCAQDLNNKTGFNFGQLMRADSCPANPTESTSDSSCNSSDGILVNFCTIYSKSNNPSTPPDPAVSPGPLQPGGLHDGSVFLNLQPVRPRSPGDRPQHAVLSPQEERDRVVPSAPCWSPQALDSNCNLYSLEPWSSLELSDLTACLQGRLMLTMGTNQKYYKLVNCDPPSKSPSPAWPGLGGRLPEGLHAAGPVLPPGSVREEERGLVMDRKESEEQHQDGSSVPPACSHVACAKYECYNYQDGSPLCKTAAPSEDTPSPRLPALASLSLAPVATVPGGQELRPARPSVKPQPSEGGEPEDGACSWAPPVLRYTKAQRPTSLPIQPFVLLPQPKPQGQPLGSLLDQYVSQRGGAGSGAGSQPGSGCKAPGGQLLAHLQASPLNHFGHILLEAPSSSDTCSTCSPSPQRPGQRRPWSRSGASQAAGSCRSLAAAQAQGPYSGATRSHLMFKMSGGNPSPRSFTAPQTQSSLLVETPTSHYLIDLSPEPPPGGGPHAAVLRPQTPGGTQPRWSHSTPPTLACTSLTQQPSLLGSLSTPPQRYVQQKHVGSRLPCGASSEPFSSAAPRSSSQGEVDSLAGPGRGKKHQNQSEHGESLMLLSDRPPTEFCLSPSEASYESLSISHLQRRGLLRSVSTAMDLIMAHFGSSRDPGEKVRLGNSNSSPTVAGLVLEHLCPAIQNILEDGLRHHNLDVVIGQRRNHSWRVVDASTQNGRASHILDNLVSKIHQCSQLTSPCMKLRAFIMGLLNLRALEFWLSHLQSQYDVVTAYYHTWAFMTTTQRHCQPLFQELLLLLQPLSVLPFDLNLLLEPRHRELCSRTSPVPACSALLMTAWPKLQAETPWGHATRGQPAGNSGPHDLHLPGLSQEPQSFTLQGRRGRRHDAGWWIRQPVIVDGVIEEEHRPSAESYSSWSPQYHATGREGVLDGGEATAGPCGRGSADPPVQAEGAVQCGLRWAKLFGAAAEPPGRAPGAAGGLRGPQGRRNTRPSQWLQLDRSTVGQLAQSVWAGKFGRAKTE